MTIVRAVMTNLRPVMLHDVRRDARSVMLRIYVCDDEPFWRNRAGKILESYVKECGLQAEIQACGSFDALLEDCRSKGVAPDVVFMDIELEDEKVPAGITAAAELNALYPECQVVFLTNYLTYALDVYQTDHVWYLLKEQLEERIPDVFGKIRRNIEALNSELLVRTLDGRLVRIHSGDIIYIEREGRKTIIYAEGGSFEVKEKLRDILDKLPESRFARCHYSYAVNLDRVKEIHTTGLVMDNGVKVLISRGYNKSFRLAFIDCAGSRMVR